MKRDYYEILEVHHKASSEIIKKAYQTLAKKYHPDTTTLSKEEAHAKMIELNEAYQVLYNKNKRKEYDDSISNTVNDNQSEKNNSTEKEITKKKVYEICQKTIDRLKKGIRYNDGYEVANKVSCDKIVAAFENEIAEYLPLVKYNENNLDVLSTNIGIVYWKIAIAYSWGNDWWKSSEYVDKASKYISELSTVYPEFIISYNRIKNSYEKRKKKDFLGFIKLWGLIIVALILFIYSAGINNSSSTREKTKSEVTTSSAQNKEFNKASDKEGNKNKYQKTTNNKPKQNVITGYDNSENQGNYGGMCRLTVDNSRNDYPVYVRIWDIKLNVPVRAFCINKGDTFTAEEMTAGFYDVRYRTLYEDDSIPKYGYKSEPIDMQQIEDEDGIRYSDVRITLYKVSNGNTKTTTIPGDKV